MKFGRNLLWTVKPSSSIVCCNKVKKKIHKTQNEYLIIVCQNLIDVLNLKPMSLFWCLYHLVFDLETIGVS